MSGNDYSRHPNTYHFTCGGCISTTVTNECGTIARWVDIKYSSTDSQGLMVGLDCQWRPNRGGADNPMAILQLCLGSKCLIVQLLYLTGWEDLRRFLADPGTIFVGDGIRQDTKKLFEHLGLVVGHRRFDLRNIAKFNFNRIDFRRMGLKVLTSEIFGFGEAPMDHNE